MVLSQVHLTVDTAMDTGSLNISAYVARKLNLGDRLLARKFQEVECEIETQEIETVGGRPACSACSRAPTMQDQAFAASLCMQSAKNRT